MKTLTAKQAAFVAAYLVDLNATQAAIRTGYSAKTAGQQGERLLKNAEIARAVADALDRRSKRVEITQDDVLRRWWEIANADARELVEYRRTCCRHCHGNAFARQETGAGFDARRDPHTDCPHCFGQGVEQVYVHDTRTLSPAGVLLYAGVKQTKDGIEVKMHDPAAALANVAKHLGMFVEKHEHTGKNGKPLIPAPTLDGMSDSDLRALAVRLASA